MSERRLGARVRHAIKQLLTPDPYSSPWYLGSVGSSVWTAPTRIDYQAEAGAPDANAIVMACINWLVTTFPEAPIRVQRRTAQAVQAVPDHPLVQLLTVPNDYYTGLDLWAATLADYNIDGNAHWIAPLNRAGRPVELWYEPSFSIRARGTADAFIACGKSIGAAPGNASTRGKTSSCISGAALTRATRAGAFRRC